MAATIESLQAGPTASNVAIDSNFKTYLEAKVKSAVNPEVLLGFLRRAFLPSPTILTPVSAPIIEKYAEPEDAINIEISRGKYFVPKTEFDQEANNGKGEKVIVKDDDGNISYKLVDKDELELEATGEEEAKKAEDDPDADVDPAGKMELKSVIQKQAREVLFENQLRLLALNLYGIISNMVADVVVEAFKGIQISTNINTEVAFDKTTSELLGVPSHHGQIQGIIRPEQFYISIKTPQ